MENGKWAYYEKGEKIVNAWMNDSVGLCYIGSGGYCVTNTFKQYTNGKWVYLNENGSQVKNTTLTIGNRSYTFDQEGFCTNY